MKSYKVRIVYLLAGLLSSALGIVITLEANIGYAPWDVLHAGLSETTGLSFGLISIIVGVIIIVVVTLLGEKFGFGSVLAIILSGVFIDLILFLEIIPKADNYVVGIIMLIVGLFILAFGSYLYIYSGFGAGPRDSLMVALTRKTKMPVGLCRGIVEVAATVGGWLLGGMFGVGTIISAVGVGFCIQIVFMIFKFDPTKVEHETLSKTLRHFIRK